MTILKYYNVYKIHGDFKESSQKYYHFLIITKILLVPDLSTLIAHVYYKNSSKCVYDVRKKCKGFPITPEDGKDCLLSNSITEFFVNKK